MKNLSDQHKQKIAVIGIGRVGLPLSLILAKEGFDVVGVDIDQEKLRLLKEKKFPFKEDGAQELLEKFYGKNFITIHEHDLPLRLSKIDTIILTLGTTIDSVLNPNISQITDFFEKYSTFFQKGQLIILRSTLTSGTTEYVARFIRETVGFEIGKDIFLACCPERIAEGHALQELYEIPQIIGAFDQESAKLSTSIFKRLTRKILYTDPRSAELAKLMCNMYRYIDFAIGNEFMLIAESHKRDIYEILRLVNEDYKRGGVKGPGFTAGACLVKDGFLLIDKSPFLDLVAAAWRVNESIPTFLINKIKVLFPSLVNKKVAILGLGFKKNIDDTRYSLSIKLKQYLIHEGAKVFTHDPFLPSLRMEEIVENADIIVLAVNHDYYFTLKLNHLSKLAKKNPIVCDIWNVLRTGKIMFNLDEAIHKKGKVSKILKNKSNTQRQK